MGKSTKTRRTPNRSKSVAIISLLLLCGMILLPIINATTEGSLITVRRWFFDANYISNLTNIDWINDTLGDQMIPYNIKGNISSCVDYHRLGNQSRDSYPDAPSDFITTVVSATQIDLAWTKGNNATHTRIMQKTDGYPVNFSDGSFVYNDTGELCANSSLTAGTTYFFRAWSWNNSIGLWSSTNVSMNNTTWSIPFAPSGFSATVSGVSQINLSWIKGNYANYTRIQRKTGSFPINISDGTNVYNDTGSSYPDTGLGINTTYYYRAWSWNATSKLWSTTNVSAVITTWNRPLTPTGFSAITVGIDHINLSWNKGINSTHTRIMQKTEGYPLNISDGSLVYNGTGVTCSNSSLSIGMRYYFRAWSWNTSRGHWSTSNASTFNITGPFAPTNLTATASSSSQINLAWSKGSYANYIRIQRKTGSYPINISDGTNVYNNTGSSYPDMGLGASTTYYYRAWGWNSTNEVWSVNYASAQCSTQSGGSEGGVPPQSSDNQAPSAEAGGPYTGFVNQTIIFSGAGSTDDAGVVGYRWDWTNDGTWDTNWLTSATTIYIYIRAGTYTVKLQVQDSGEITDTDTTTVTVSATANLHQAPVAESGGPYSGLTYQNIRFNGSRSYGINASLVNYTWVFGDGTYGQGMAPIHVYETAGTFTVFLSVKDTNNLQAIDTTTITIVLDANRNNISDIMEQTIGVNITQSDLQTISINDILYYFVDINNDRIYDVLYNPITNTKTTLGQQNGKQLIDINSDGLWDYVYDPALGTTAAYKRVNSPFDITLISIAIIAIIIVVIFLIIWSYRTGRI